MSWSVITSNSTSWDNISYAGAETGYFPLNYFPDFLMGGYFAHGYWPFMYVWNIPESQSTVNWSEI